MAGRKPKVDPSIVDREILKHKNEIFDGKRGVNWMGHRPTHLDGTPPPSECSTHAAEPVACRNKPHAAAAAVVLVDVAVRIIPSAAQRA
ncbi:hypothetical protein ACI65C_010809, partial [Semiaphis heraclei]